MAHLESPSRKLPIQYINALVDTILLFVGNPMIALASLILIPSLRWAPQFFPIWHSFSQLGLGLILWIPSVIIGHIWLGRKFKKYRRSFRLFAVQLRQRFENRVLAEDHCVLCLRDCFAVSGDVHHLRQSGSHESV
jgi:hypothetical protein